METDTAKRNVKSGGREQEWDVETQSRLARVVAELTEFYDPIRRNLEWIRMAAATIKAHERTIFGLREYIRELEGQLHNEEKHGKQTETD